MSDRPRVGLTLPSFVEDPEQILAVARVAEEGGVDGVFVFDHMFRRAADGTRRPALEAVTMLGALAAATTRITIGTLVLRASMRPAATSAAAVGTVARLAPGRVIVGIGAGDSESREENEAFGLGFGSLPERLARLVETTRAVRDRGVTVWIGGLAPEVRAVASREADGWNAWGLDAERFGSWARETRAVAERAPFECSWGGLAVVDDTNAAAGDLAHTLHAPSTALVGGPDHVAAVLEGLHGAGAAWVILGAVDASNPRTARVLGEAVLPRLARA